jgi:N-acetylglucosamine transport system permease protein
VPVVSESVPASRSAARAERRVRLGPLSGLSHVALIVWTVLVVVPLAWTFLASFKSEDEIFGDGWSLPAVPRFDNWARAWDQAHVGRYLLNSVIVVSFGTFGTMLLGSMAAYVLARYRFRGSRAIYLLFVSGLAFPVYLALTPLFFVVRNIGNIPIIGPFVGLDSYGGLILVYIAY